MCWGRGECAMLGRKGRFCTVLGGGAIVLFGGGVIILCWGRAHSTV